MLIIAAIPGLVVLLIGMAEFVFFYDILSKGNTRERADVIAVFEGGRDRVKAGYQLVDRTMADSLVISPANVHQLRAYERRYQPERKFKRIIEKNARTTLENAIYTHNIVEQHNFNSVILVTSWYHMPRSYLLLKIILADPHKHIQPHFVATDKLNHNNWYHHLIGWKMVYNEMLEFWGSLYELAKFQITGKINAKQPGKSPLMDGLKKRLLFKIYLPPTTAYPT